MPEATLGIGLVGSPLDSVLDPATERHLPVDLFEEYGLAEIFESLLDQIADESRTIVIFYDEYDALLPVLQELRARYTARLVAVAPAGASNYNCTGIDELVMFDDRTDGVEAFIRLTETMIDLGGSNHAETVNAAFAARKIHMEGTDEDDVAPAA